jgi:hypothetical protein
MEVVVDNEGCQRPLGYTWLRSSLAKLKNACLGVQPRHSAYWVTKSPYLHVFHEQNTIKEGITPWFCTANLALSKSAEHLTYQTAF